MKFILFYTSKTKWYAIFKKIIKVFWLIANFKTCDI